MYEIKNKVILITGGSNGIGACLVKEFLGKGALHVAVLDVDDKSGEALEAKLSSEYGEKRIKYYHCDVTSSDLDSAYEKVLDEMEYIDVVINSAGIFNDTPEGYLKMININLAATITSSLKAYGLMRKDRGGKGGTVINISSIAALMLLDSVPIYSATKKAVLHFTTSLGLPSHYNRSNVRYITVCFGLTDTDLVRNLFGKQIDKESELDLKNGISNFPLQSGEVAARGLIEAYEQGASASTWLIASGKSAKDITANVNEAYKILEQEL